MTESEDLNQAIAADRGEKGELKSFSALAGLFGKSESSDKPASKPGSNKPGSKKQQAPKPEPQASEKVPAKADAPDDQGPNKPAEALSGATPPPPATPDVPEKQDNADPTGGKVEEKEKFGEDFV